MGTRAASVHGLTDAWELGAFLGAAGVTVVSGLAIGIDGAAHHGALQAAEAAEQRGSPFGGGPVGVVATGLDIVYPRRHRALFERVRALRRPPRRAALRRRRLSGGGSRCGTGSSPRSPMWSSSSRPPSAAGRGSPPIGPSTTGGRSWPCPAPAATRPPPAATRSSPTVPSRCSTRPTSSSPSASPPASRRLWSTAPAAAKRAPAGAAAAGGAQGPRRRSRPPRPAGLPHRPRPWPGRPGRRGTRRPRPRHP